MSTQPSTSGFWFVHDPRYKYAIGGVPIVVGVLLFLGFFAFSWVSPDDDKAREVVENKVDGADTLVEEIAEETDQDEDDVRDSIADQFSGFGSANNESKSAWAIWRGAEDAMLRFDEDYEGEDGFGEVETRDRLLILIPLLAIGLVAVGVAYLMDRLDQRRTLIGIIAIAALLFILPLLWQMLKSGYVSSNLNDLAEGSPYSDEANDQLIDVAVAAVTSIYSTFEFVWLAFIALMFGIGTWFILDTESRREGGAAPAAAKPKPAPSEAA